MDLAFFAIALCCIALAQHATATTATATTTSRNAQQVVDATPTTTTTSTWQATFTPAALQLNMGTKAQVLLELSHVDTTQPGQSFRLVSENPHLVAVQHVIPADNIDPSTGSWRGNVTVEALFLGEARVHVQRINSTERSASHLKLTIIRRTRIIDHVFTASVALLVSLLYINFGAALDVSVLRSLLARPVAPAIGLITQFLIMPLLGYALGVWLFPDSVELQLGLFFTGVSPSGGASNIWTVILGGNIHLSVLMTALGNFAAFGMMPLWLFTLGRVIFERGDMEVPYTNIATFAVSLVVPLCIGLAIQRWSPRLTGILVRLLKPISTVLILFIIIFAIVTNLYLFELFSWQIVVAGLSLPWLGYLLSWCAAKALRRNSADALTIAIETGIQNTGISIFLLRFSLPQPQADLTTVVPVAVAILTPFPLLALYLFKRCSERGVKMGIAESTQIVGDHSN